MSARKIKLDICKEWLYDQHIVQGKAASKIAKELGCDQRCIIRRLKDFGIEYRKKIGVLPSKFIGKKFDFLLVIEYAGKNKHNAKTWKCLCDCGKERVVVQTCLTTCLTTSCGCQKKWNPANKKQIGGLIGATWRQILHSAKKRCIDVSITQEYAWNLFLKQNEKCALTGLPITLPGNTKDFQSHKCTASLDRINSKIGYVEGNVQWVHKTINVMKMWLKESEFDFFCLYRAKFLQEKLGD